MVLLVSVMFDVRVCAREGSEAVAALRRHARLKQEMTCQGCGNAVPLSYFGRMQTAADGWGVLWQPVRTGARAVCDVARRPPLHCKPASQPPGARWNQLPWDFAKVEIFSP